MRWSCSRDCTARSQWWVALPRSVLWVGRSPHTCLCCPACGSALSVCLTVLCGGLWSQLDGLKSEYHDSLYCVEVSLDDFSPVRLCLCLSLCPCLCLCTSLCLCLPACLLVRPPPSLCVHLRMDVRASVTVTKIACACACACVCRSCLRRATPTVCCAR